VTLDQLEGGIDLVGTVECDRNPPRPLVIEQRYSESHRRSAGFLRSRNTDDAPATRDRPWQQFQEEAYRRTSAQTDDTFRG
jgi:hypothetical protein